MSSLFTRCFLAGILGWLVFCCALPLVQGQDVSKTPAKTAAAKTADAKTSAKTGATKTGAAKTPAKTGAAPAPAKPAGVSLTDMKDGQASSTIGQRLMSCVGLVVLLGICVLMSNNRKKINWRLVGWGIGLQLILGILVMVPFPGIGKPLLRPLFQVVNDVFVSLMGYSTEGSKLLFGNLATVNNVPVGPGGPFGPVGATKSVANVGAFFAFNVLPTIIFFSSLMAVLYHSGFMQWVVQGVAYVMQRTMGTSGSETLSAAGNIFVGQTEAPLLVRPFVSGMTESELMAIMTGGFATVAGGVMAAYVGMLIGQFPDIAGHLLSASIMSAPAALVCAKLIVPEPIPEKSETFGELKVELEKVDVNIIDAAARGAGDGMKLAFNVGAMLLAFVALIAMANGLLNFASNQVADVIYGDAWSERVKDLKSELSEAQGMADTAAAEAAAEAGQPKSKAPAPLDPKVAQAFNDRFVVLAKEALGYAPDAAFEATFDPHRKAPATRSSTGLLTIGPGDFDAKVVAVRGQTPETTSASPYRGRMEKPGAEQTWRNLKFETIFGWLLAPLAFLMGVPWADAAKVGQLIGVKTVVNEFIAYDQLGGMLRGGELQYARSKVIATYALCGFANFSSIAIQIGGIGGIAPDRRHDLAKLGLRAMIGGTIAALLTATVAGILI